MGASGAGKTSLPNLLSDRVVKRPGVSIKGKINFNDTYELDAGLFSKYACYVM